MPNHQAVALRSKTFVDRAPRQSAQCVARIMGPTVAPFDSRVRNISTSGMLIDHDGQVAIGDDVIARFPEMADIMGTIVRLRDGTAGIRFSSPLNLHEFRKAS